MKSENLNEVALQRANAWMNPPFDQATQDEVQLMVRAGGEPLVEAFLHGLRIWYRRIARTDGARDQPHE